jgi:tetratricopeptide (TPR) repeat protein
MKRSVRRAAAMPALSLPMLALAAVASTVPAGTALAQPAASACAVDQSKPKQLGLASLALVQAQGNTSNPAARTKSLRDAVKQSTEGKLTENPTGRDYLLAQALVLWTAEPGMSGTVKRAELGYTSNPEGTIDVLAAADSALTRLQTALPGCAELATQLRQQQGWLNLVNGAIAALNAKQLDSAAALANRSLVINRETPYPYHVLSAVAAQKNDVAAAMDNWTKVISLAGSDTSFRPVRQAALYNLGIAQLDAATAASGADQKAKAEQAAATIRTFLAEAGTSAEGPQMQDALARALKLTGDASALSAVYADQLANPSKYTDLALSQAGVIAAQAGKTEDAARLFEHALASNPHQRDALNNLAAMYYGLNQFDKMLPIVDRLTKVDPSNPDNWMFAAYAYQGLGKAAKSASPQQKAYTDSLLKYKALAEKLPVKLTFTQFTRGAERATLAGTLENLAPAAKAYTVTFEFLDAQGNVVATESATVGPLEKGKSAPVSVTVPKGGVVAFRYAPIS